MLRKALIASSILLLSATANAEGGYIGLSVGKSDVDLYGFDDGSSMAITGGYKINPNFAVEASYVDLGDSSDNIAPVWTLEASGLNFAAVGILPINQKVDLFGKVGLFMWDASLNEAGTGEIASDDGTDLSFGFGLTGKLTEQFGLTFEYQQFELDDVDVSNISFGARLNF